MKLFSVVVISVVKYGFWGIRLFSVWLDDGSVRVCFFWF